MVLCVRVSLFFLACFEGSHSPPRIEMTDVTGDHPRTAFLLLVGEASTKSRETVAERKADGLRGRESDEGNQKCQRSHSIFSRAATAEIGVRLCYSCDSAGNLAVLTGGCSPALHAAANRRKGSATRFRAYLVALIPCALSLSECCRMTSRYFSPCI
jgi:hypothetical protein